MAKILMVLILYTADRETILIIWADSDHTGIIVIQIPIPGCTVIRTPPEATGPNTAKSSVYVTATTGKGGKPTLICCSRISTLPMRCSAFFKLVACNQTFWI